MGLNESKQLFTTLNNGVIMPLLGLGTYDILGNDAISAVSLALETGYRLIDTAQMYENEKEVGEGIRQSGVDRNDVFVTTKINNTRQGYDETMRSFEESMNALNIGHIDLLLIHWPIKGKRQETWKALEALYQAGMVRAIGTGNYLLPFLKERERYGNIIPAVNQIEFSPYLFLQEELDYCRSNGIVLQAYTPLLRGQKFSDPRLIQLSKQYGKTPAQLILRWAVQQGISTIPKSSNPDRIRENFDIFNFTIDESDLEFMNSFHEGFRIVDDPMGMW